MLKTSQVLSIIDYYQTVLVCYENLFDVKKIADTVSISHVTTSLIDFLLLTIKLLQTSM